MSPNQHTAIMLLPLAGLTLAGVVCLAVWYWRHGRPATPLTPAAAEPVRVGPSTDDEIREARLAAQIALMKRYGVSHPRFGIAAAEPVQDHPDLPPMPRPEYVWPR